MRKPTITVYRGRSSWMARFDGDAEVFRLFGTDTLATPYSERTLPNMVRLAIEALNPGHDVIMQPDGAPGLAGFSFQSADDWCKAHPYKGGL